MKKSVLLMVVGVFCAISASCGGSNGIVTPPTGLLDRVAASQGVTTANNFGGIFLINGWNDIVSTSPLLGAGNSPGMMQLSPGRNILAAYDSSSNSVFAINTTTDKSIGQVRLPCPTTTVECLGRDSSFIVPTSNPIGFAAVSSAVVNGTSLLGGVVEMNFANSTVSVTIAVPNAQSVVSANSSASQLLVFSSDSNSVTVLTPGNAVPPVDSSCNNPPNAVCTVVPGFDRPVYALINGNTALVLNCGAECGGTQASVAFFDLTTLSITKTVPVEGATWGLLNGSTLYVVGTPPTNNACTGETTAATTCGRLDIVDTGTGTVTTSGIVITDGYHDRIDLNEIGQLFIGAYECTNIGDVNDPVGEVRGCLSIYNLSNNSVLIPPDNGNVDGMQGFVTRQVEYVAEDGNLRVYDAVTDTLYIDDYLTTGTIPAVGYVGDVKALDLF